MSKWKINLKSVVENFHQAIKAYDTENLIGIIFGSKELQIISNVFFTRNEDEEIESLTLELAAFLPPEIHCLGFITIKENGDIPIESLIKKISIIDGVNLHIEWSLEHLKLKNVTKLLESANFVENNESLSMLDGVFIKSSVLVSFQIQNEKNFETEVKEEISKKKSQVLEQLFIHEETKSTFSKTSKSSSLAKIQKADKKNYIVLKGKDNNEISNGTDVNNDP
uniref:Uncharacterized protein n=1 Tax=Acrobeloides nanus TaxID=290746 RepID=A0A914CP67_9BILA